MNIQPLTVDYDSESDVLEIYFGAKQRAWTIELTDNIMLGIDRATQEPASLTLLDLSELARQTELGPRSFPLTGLADLPQRERELVIRILTSPPVNEWLDVSVVQDLLDSPFAVTHLQPLAVQQHGLAPV
jgi:hypothetical protein